MTPWKFQLLSSPVPLSSPSSSSLAGTLATAAQEVMRSGMAACLTSPEETHPLHCEWACPFWPTAADWAVSQSSARCNGNIHLADRAQTQMVQPASFHSFLHSAGRTDTVMTPSFCPAGARHTGLSFHSTYCKHTGQNLNSNGMTVDKPYRNKILFWYTLAASFCVGTDF